MFEAIFMILKMLVFFAILLFIGIFIIIQTFSGEKDREENWLALISKVLSSVFLFVMGALIVFTIWLKVC